MRNEILCQIRDQIVIFRDVRLDVCKYDGQTIIPRTQINNIENH